MESGGWLSKVELSFSTLTLKYFQAKNQTTKTVKQKSEK